MRVPDSYRVSGDPRGWSVPLGDERLDAMLAGGLRPGELCGLCANLEVGLGGVRRVLGRIVGHRATRIGPVLYFALTPAAGGARRQVTSQVGPRAGEAVLAPAVRAYTVESLEDRA